MSYTDAADAKLMALGFRLHAHSRALWLLAGAVMAADILTTWIVVAQVGIGVEANPVAAHLMAELGALPAMLGLKGALLLLLATIYALAPKWASGYTLPLVALITAPVIINNLHVIHTLFG